MGNKILVELNVEDLKRFCNNEGNPIACCNCKQTDEQLIKCNLYCSDFKIKEQKNGN